MNGFPGSLAERVSQAAHDRWGFGPAAQAAALAACAAAAFSVAALVGALAGGPPFPSGPMIDIGAGFAMGHCALRMMNDRTPLPNGSAIAALAALLAMAELPTWFVPASTSPSVAFALGCAICSEALRRSAGRISRLDEADMEAGRLPRPRRATAAMAGGIASLGIFAFGLSGALLHRAGTAAWLPYGAAAAGGGVSCLAFAALACVPRPPRRRRASASPWALAARA